MYNTLIDIHSIFREDPYSHLLVESPYPLALIHNWDAKIFDTFMKIFADKHPITSGGTSF